MHVNLICRIKIAIQCTCILFSDFIKLHVKSVEHKLMDKHNDVIIDG